MKPLAEQSLYEILDVPPGSGSAEIAAALDRTLSLIGPGSLAMYSLMSPEDATTLARRVEEARTTLLDPAARSRYDAGLEPEAPPAPAELPPVIPALRPEQMTLSAAAEDEPPIEPGTATPTATPAPSATAADSAAEPPRPPPESPPDSPPERPAYTPPPGGYVWPPPQPAAQQAPPEPAAPAPAPTPTPTPAPTPAAPAAPAPLQLTTPLPTPPPSPAPRPILLEREVAPQVEPPPAPAAAPPPPASAAPPAPRGPTPIPEFASWTGYALRSVREARGLSLQQVAERTKVTRHHLENIEADRYAQLPAAVYLRGILLSLARELRLDGQKVSRSYLERMAAAPAPPPPGPQRR